MDMRRAVRPEAHIDLGCLREPPYYTTRSMKQRSHLGSLVRGQVRHPLHVTQRLDQKGPHSKRSDAVLNPPVVGLMDKPTRKIAASAGEITGNAVVHVGHGTRIRGEAGSDPLVDLVASGR